ncbi:MAG: calcium:proton antiporter [Streptosporangiales bacterium]
MSFPVTAVRSALASWPLVLPPLAFIVLLLTWGRRPGPAVVVVVALLLIAAVLSAVQHAEVVAHWVGEPFGSLILAVAVTVIEVGLIVTLMVSGGPKTSTLARDTVFAAVMITCNGILGLSLLTGSTRFRLAVFNAEGAVAGLGTVATLATLSLVLPRFTLGRAGPQFSPAQLGFAAAASLLVYVMFVVTQNVRHRDFFLPVNDDGVIATEEHAAPPAARTGVASLALLLLSLVAVVGLAKTESPAIESGLKAAGLPQSFVGVVIALLVLLPETLTAVRAAHRNRVQISINLAFGSAIASIGLTIPVIAAASRWLEGPLLLGLSPTQIVLLAVTIVVGGLTVIPGRATRLQGGIHLILLAAFLFLAIKP